MKTPIDLTSDLYSDAACFQCFNTCLYIIFRREYDVMNASLIFHIEIGSNGLIYNGNASLIIPTFSLFRFIQITQKKNSFFSISLEIFL